MNAEQIKTYGKLFVRVHNGLINIIKEMKYTDVPFLVSFYF